MSNNVKFAEEELRRAGYDVTDDFPDEVLAK